MNDTRCYVVAGVRAMHTAALVVVDRAEQNIVESFLRWCWTEQVEIPLQLWVFADLPGWLRRATGTEREGEA